MENVSEMCLETFVSSEMLYIYYKQIFLWLKAIWVSRTRGVDWIR